MNPISLSILNTSKQNKIKIQKTMKNLLHKIFGVFNFKSLFINFNIVVFIAFISYRFYLGLNGEYITIFVSFVSSFLISSFALNKFKFSENLFIRILQRIMFLILCFIISCCFMFFYFHF